MKISKYAFKITKTPLGQYIVGLAFQNFTSVLPIKKLEENKYVIAFYHPKPFWEEHILIVPKKKISGLENINSENEKYLGEMFKMVSEIVKKLNWQNADYSTLINGGSRQDVAQLHLHLFKGSEIQ